MRQQAAISSTARPTVSVIVPCYRVTEFIRDALDSLRSQTYRDFETIVINDGCPDTANLERVLAPYRQEVLYLRQENGGLAQARNAGISAAHGRLVSLLDPDDAWEPNYLETQVRMLDASPDVAVVYPNARYFGDSSWAGRLFMDMLPSKGEVTVAGLIEGRCHVFVGVTARRDAILQVGSFDPDLRRGEDFDLWLRLLRAGFKITYHEQPLVRYRLRQSSLSDDRTELLKCRLVICRKLLRMGLDEADRAAAERCLQVDEAEIEYLEGKKELYRGHCMAARAHLARANQVLRRPKLSVALRAIRIAPGLIYRYVHFKHKTEHSFLH